MPDEVKTFSGPLVLNLIIWWRHVHTLYCLHVEIIPASMGLDRCTTFRHNTVIVRSSASSRTLVSLCYFWCQQKLLILPGAHYPEPPYELHPWVNPFPYLFIFRNTSHEGLRVFFYNSQSRESCDPRYPLLLKYLRAAACDSTQPVLLQPPTTYRPCILQRFSHALSRVCIYSSQKHTRYCYSRNDVRSQLVPFSAIPRSWT